MCRWYLEKSLMNKDLKFVMEGMHLPVEQERNHGPRPEEPWLRGGTFGGSRNMDLQVLPGTIKRKLDKCRKIDRSIGARKDASTS
jgi:hypothetical protein